VKKMQLEAADCTESLKYSDDNAESDSDSPDHVDLDDVVGGLVVMEEPNSRSSKNRDSGNSKESGTSRYIESLKHHTKKRELEMDIVEAKLLKAERVKDAELYGEKEVFVTAAYQRKIDERKILEAQLEEEERKQKEDSVTKRKDLTDFHRNFMLRETTKVTDLEKCQDPHFKSRRTECSTVSHESGNMENVEMAKSVGPVENVEVPKSVEPVANVEVPKSVETVDSVADGVSLESKRLSARARYLERRKEQQCVHDV